MNKQAVFLFFAVFAACFSYHAQAQLAINTIAGTGTAAYSGDGGPATAANINTPYGVAVDAIGNVYFTDYNNNRIRKIDTFGVITTIAGTGTAGFLGDSGPATDALLYAPRGIAVDGTGNVYFSDYANNRIRKIDVSGTINTIAGDGFAAFTGDGGPATVAALNFPWGVAVDPAGNVYIADQVNSRVRKINTSGIISTIGGTGIAFFSGDGGPAISAGIQYPMGVAVDAAGNVFVADDGDCRIRKINTAGIISTVAGNGMGGYTGDGGPATSAKLYYPQGIALDALGNIYIADLDNNRIRKVTLSSGIISTVAGNGAPAYSGDGGPPTLAAINQSTGVAAGSTGNIYISDNDNSRIRIVHIVSPAPYFTGGHVQQLAFCPTESVNIDSLLTIFAADSGQTETWSLLLPPSHGTAVTDYAATADRDSIVPSGLSYEMGSGSITNDTFKVRVTDGTYSDTTTIYVTILPLPFAGAITGIDSICPGDTATFTDTAAGGVWSSSSAAICSISAGGRLTGVAPGTAELFYSVTTPCGTATAAFSFIVRSGCPLRVSSLSAQATDKITIYPNPGYGNFTAGLQSGNTEDVHFTVTNIMGETVKEISSVTNIPVTIRLNGAAGIYFLSAVTAHGKWEEKLVLEK